MGDCGWAVGHPRSCSPPSFVLTAPTALTNTHPAPHRSPSQMRQAMGAQAGTLLEDVIGAAVPADVTLRSLASLVLSRITRLLTLPCRSESRAARRVPTPFRRRCWFVVPETACRPAETELSSQIPCPAPHPSGTTPPCDRS